MTTGEPQGAQERGWHVGDWSDCWCGGRHATEFRAFAAVAPLSAPPEPTETAHRMWALENVTRHGTPKCPYHLDDIDADCHQCAYVLGWIAGGVSAGAYYTSEEAFSASTNAPPVRMTRGVEGRRLAEHPTLDGSPSEQSSASSPPETTAPTATPHIHEFDAALPSVDGWLYDGCECGATKIVGCKGPAVRAFLAGEEPPVSLVASSATPATCEKCAGTGIVVVTIERCRNGCAVPSVQWPVVRAQLEKQAASSATPTPEPTPSFTVLTVCGAVSHAESRWPCSKLPGHYAGHENAASHWPRRPSDTCVPEGTTKTDQSPARSLTTEPR